MSTRQALYEGRALREQKADVKARAVKRAADNVEDKSCESVTDAARGQGVSEESVRNELRRRKALRDAGAMSDLSERVST